MKQRKLRKKKTSSKPSSIISNKLPQKPNINDLFHQSRENQQQGLLNEAELGYRELLKRQPNHVATLNNFGLVLSKKGAVDEALDCFHRIIKIKPDFAQAHNNLGIILKEQCNKFDEALIAYQKAVTIDPDFSGAWRNIASLLKELSLFDDAIEVYKKAIRLNPAAGTVLHWASALPIIPVSTAQIIQVRTDIAEKIKKLTEDGLTLADPYEASCETNFYLAYHNLDDLLLQQAIAQLYLQATPHLAWTAPHCGQPLAKKQLIRVGIISAYWFDHTMGKLNLGTIRCLSRDKFEVVLLRFNNKPDDMAQAINDAADHVVLLPKNLAMARQLIAQQQLDILFYTDIGMDPFTYFLSYSRLARIQCVTWGHPDTTGIPNIDYFLSHVHMEIDNAQSLYSEQLVLLNHLPYYYRPPPPTHFLRRKDFNLPQEGHLYVCPQSLFKFHPDFDSFWGNILRRDTEGYLVIIEGNHKQWTNLLQRRFQRVFNDVIRRVVFVPRMSKNDFFSLLKLADVLLDPPYFGGGNSSLEAFALGVPLVTLPSHFLRGRITYACYQRMGIFDLVVNSPDEFVNKAYRVANDPTWRNEIMAKINDRSHLLYENREAIVELETFFEQAHQKVSRAH